jgi:hypothetical protein
LSKQIFINHKNKNNMRYSVIIDDAEVPRVEEAYGSILNLRDESGNPRPATKTEIETAIFTWLEGSTHDYERRKNMSSFTPPPLGGAAAD